MSSRAPEQTPEQLLGKSDWIVVDQNRIDQFADCTEDRQFIHVDPVAASESPLGGTVAHGFLTLSLVSRMCLNLLPDAEVAGMVLNYGLERVRFLSPVRAGSRVRAVGVLKERVEKKPGQVLTRMGVSVESEGQDKPVLVADWLTLSLSNAAD